MEWIALFLILAIVTLIKIQKVVTLFVLPFAMWEKRKKGKKNDDKKS